MIRPDPRLPQSLPCSDPLREIKPSFILFSEWIRTSAATSLLTLMRDHVHVVFCGAESASAILVPYGVVLDILVISDLFYLYHYP